VRSVRHFIERCIRAGATGVLAANAILAQAPGHQVSADAMRAYDKGRYAAGQGSGRQAIVYFLEALAIDPQFAGAHNDLGAVYLTRGELPQAVEQFQKTIDLAPEHRLALSNLSIALIRMNRCREAGEVARRTLELEPGQARAHLILAAALLAQAGDTGEALAHLERASAEIPKAHMLAAGLLAKAGRRHEAVDHLEEYLRLAAPQDAERFRAKAWLDDLRQQPSR
jgi:tetratricopeptide (TPR) repeat protein